jgi:hypothetical protein
MVGLIPGFRRGFFIQKYRSRYDIRINFKKQIVMSTSSKILGKKYKVMTAIASHFFGSDKKMVVWAEVGEMVTVIGDHGNAIIVKTDKGQHVPAKKTDIKIPEESE